jgi:hypothetical protein
MAQSRCLTSGTVSGNRSVARFIGSTPPDCRLADGSKISECEHCQRDVTMPADPGAYFVLVQADLTLGLLKQALDAPARARDPRQRG